MIIKFFRYIFMVLKLSEKHFVILKDETAKIGAVALSSVFILLIFTDFYEYFCKDEAIKFER